MGKLAAFAWTISIVIFFVGMKALIILPLIVLLIAVLYMINPKWFEPHI